MSLDVKFNIFFYILFNYSECYFIDLDDFVSTIQNFLIQFLKLKLFYLKNLMDTKYNVKV